MEKGLNFAFSSALTKQVKTTFDALNHSLSNFNPAFQLEHHFNPQSGLFYLTASLPDKKNIPQQAALIHGTITGNIFSGRLFVAKGQNGELKNIDAIDISSPEAPKEFFNNLKKLGLPKGSPPSPKKQKQPKIAFATCADIPEAAPPTLTRARKRYVHAKINRIAAILRRKIAQHNPALNLQTNIVPETGLFRFTICVGTQRLPHKNIAMIDGKLDAKWGYNAHGRGKKLNLSGRIYVADEHNGNLIGLHDIDLRDRQTAFTFFEQLRDLGLPAGQTPRVRHAWQQAQNLRFRPWEMPNSDTPPAPSQITIQKTNAGHINTIKRATRMLGRHLRNRFCQRNPIFRDINTAYDPAKNLFSIKFTPRDNFATQTDDLKIEGPIALFGTHATDKNLRILFTPQKGLDICKDDPAQAIEINRRLDAATDLIQLILNRGYIDNVPYVSDGHTCIVADIRKTNHDDIDDDERPKRTKRQARRTQRRQQNILIKDCVKRGVMPKFTADF